MIPGFGRREVFVIFFAQFPSEMLQFLRQRRLRSVAEAKAAAPVEQRGTPCGASARLGVRLFQHPAVDSDASWAMIYVWLVVEAAYPSEKYDNSSVGMMTFPTEWKNKSHVPKHLPDL